MSKEVPEVQNKSFLVGVWPYLRCLVHPLYLLNHPSEWNIWKKIWFLSFRVRIRLPSSSHIAMVPCKPTFNKACWSSSLFWVWVEQYRLEHRTTLVNWDCVTNMLRWETNSFLFVWHRHGHVLCWKKRSDAIDAIKEAEEVHLDLVASHFPSPAKVRFELVHESFSPVWLGAGVLIRLEVAESFPCEINHLFIAHR